MDKGNLVSAGTTGWQVIPGGKSSPVSPIDPETISEYQRTIADLKDRLYEQTVILDEVRALIMEGIDIHRASDDLICRGVAAAGQLPEAERARIRRATGVSREDVMRLAARRDALLDRMQAALDLMVRTRRALMQDVG